MQKKCPHPVRMGESQSSPQTPHALSAPSAGAGTTGFASTAAASARIATSGASLPKASPARGATFSSPPPRSGFTPPPARFTSPAPPPSRSRRRTCGPSRLRSSAVRLPPLHSLRSGVRSDMMDSSLDEMNASPRAAYSAWYLARAAACTSSYFVRSSRSRVTSTVVSVFGGSSRILRPPKVWFLAWRTVMEAISSTASVGLRPMAAPVRDSGFLNQASNRFRVCAGYAPRNFSCPCRSVTSEPMGVPVHAQRRAARSSWHALDCAVVADLAMCASSSTTRYHSILAVGWFNPNFPRSDAMV